ncbi:hypothetical protein [Alistipes sp.]|uniref:hypothetical protein n=1 Tax=Alistipes sp. TaxID=1872444 RepID=UPI003AEFDBD2
MALLAIWPWLAVILCAVIWIFVEIFSPRIDPIDNQATRSRELVRQLFVVDDKRNGFRVRYITKEPVTKERLDEIQRRTSVRDSMERLRTKAPKVFGNMLLTDIYDFAGFAVQFDPADIRIHNIFVCGPDKEKLYIGENPRIENWAKWIHPESLQGLLYLTSEDIYCNTARWGKVYRYHECRGNNQISVTDEHFSHFSEEERIY